LTILLVNVTVLIKLCINDASYLALAMTGIYSVNV